MDLAPYIYHEKQEKGSMLCAQHALNNLLQGPLFTPQDLADIARRIDQLEAQHLDDHFQQVERVGSQNYDDSGYFSITVIEEALKVLGLKLTRWESPEMKNSQKEPELLEGYILNHHLHWYTIRRFVYAERIYNLDSSKELPEWISPLYLDLTLQQAKMHGYSVFVVSPMGDAAVSGLPPCEAADFAVSLSLPNSRYGHETSVRQGEQVNHVALESTSTSSSSLIQPSITEREQLSAVRQPLLSKRRQQDDVENESSGLLPSVEALREHRHQRRRLASGESPKSSRSPSLSSKGANSSSALDIDLTEEDQVASAITESLQASNLRDTSDELQTVKVSSPPREDSPDDIIIVEPGLKIAPPSSMVAQRNSRSVSRRAQSTSLDSTSKSRTKARNSLEESADDDELRAALAASLLDIPLASRSSSITNDDKVEEVNSDEDHEQDDSPSMEELRKRRLARFGSTQ